MTDCSLALGQLRKAFVSMSLPIQLVVTHTLFLSLSLCMCHSDATTALANTHTQMTMDPMSVDVTLINDLDPERHVPLLALECRLQVSFVCRRNFDV